MTTVKAIFHGKVQDVFFRDNTKDTAQLHGVHGYVKNLEDGTVEAVFQGHEEMVHKVIRNLEKGVGDAKVTKVDIEEIHDPVEFHSFEIKAV